LGIVISVERPCHDRDGQDPKFLRHLGDHGRRTRAGAAAHAGRDEQHVGTLDDLVDAIAILHRRLAADVRVRAGTESLGNVASDLQRRSDARTLQRLRIGIRTDEIDALDAGIDHVRDGIAATSPDADHLYDRALAVCIHQFKHSSFLRLSSLRGTH
jgi:hypothetical protein